MLSKSVLALTLVESVIAFPWVANQAGIDRSLLKRQQTYPNGPGSAQNCPFNANHTGAAPYNAAYPYNYAHGGLPGKGVGGYLVPAPGDTAHYFVAPDYTKDIRGPCPGLNAAANHNFLSHDGITTFNELVDAQQQVYNVGYDLATLLAVLGLTTTDGDIATERLSIGCDATTRTSISPAVTGSEPGLDGHNKFEADSSLSRNDYFTHNGDNFKFNHTLFEMMENTAGPNITRDSMALYRYQRYQQSIQENPNFYFGPFSLLLFGASAFVYELMPSAESTGTGRLQDVTSFFGASKNTTSGGYYFNGQEKIPANWRARTVPFTDELVGEEIFAQYLEYPVLFGGNTGNGQFDVISGSNGIQNGKLNATSPASVMCLVYQLATERIPSSLNSVVTPTVDAIAFAVSKLGPAYSNLGCAIPLS